MHTTSIVQAPSLTLAFGITIPDSKMAREITELVRDTVNSLLFNHSSRVYYFSAATGKRKGPQEYKHTLWTLAAMMQLEAQFNKVADEIKLSDGRQVLSAKRAHTTQEERSGDFKYIDLTSIGAREPQ